MSPSFHTLMESECPVNHFNQQKAAQVTMCQLWAEVMITSVFVLLEDLSCHISCLLILVVRSHGRL